MLFLKAAFRFSFSELFLTAFENVVGLLQGSAFNVVLCMVLILGWYFLSSFINFPPTVSSVFLDEVGGMRTNRKMITFLHFSI